MMTLPDMRDRCVRIGSAGKTFSLTGWKVGYISAPAAMLGPITKCHQFLVFTTPPNLQRATAYGLGKDDDYFRGLAGGLQRSRDRFQAGLKDIGFDVMDCAGNLFHHGRFPPMIARMGGFNGDDVEFCTKLTKEAGVTAVPVSAFYQDDPPRHFARFSFCKDDATLDEALAADETVFRGVRAGR